MPDEPEQPGERGRESPPAGERRQSDAGPPAWTALAGIGLEFLTTIGVMGALGWYLDRRWNTFPWLMVAGIAIGFAAGLMIMIRSARQAFKD